MKETIKARVIEERVKGNLHKRLEVNGLSVQGKLRIIGGMLEGMEDGQTVNITLQAKDEYKELDRGSQKKGKSRVGELLKENPSHVEDD